MIRTLTAALLACTLAACAGGKPTPQPIGDGAVALGEVKPRRLRTEQCSLILWTRQEPQMRVLIAVDQPAEAEARIGGRDRTFKRTGQSGALLRGHAESQTWRASDGSTLTAEIRFDLVPGDDTGAVIRDASLSFTDRAGETLIMPVVGLLVCGRASG